MVVTRFPPSPTGYLHIGGARTALYSWLHARQQQGRFVLRIEDTDLARSTQESVQAILDGMTWLGLDYDEGPYFQTQRFDRYAAVVEQLLADGKAYHCECSKERLETMREEQKSAGQKPKYDGRCRELGLSASSTTVTRFKTPLDGDVVIHDLVKGDIVIANQELDDLVIARADGVPTYNLTVVVDDMDMGITHVIRGDDHINNTPRQIHILQALNAELPAYAHVPMILGADGARMSKRHGAVSVMQYRDEGYLPDALLSYLARLGWSHGDQELFTRQELLELFRIEKVAKAASTFDPDKLLWVNQEKIKALSPDELFEAAQWHFAQAGLDVSADDYTLSAIALIQERCKTLCDVVQQSRWFFTEVTEYDAAATKKWLKPASLDLLRQLIGGFERLDDWAPASIHQVIQAVVEANEVGFAKVAQPIRIALTGGTMSPSIDLTMSTLGRDVSLERLKRAVTQFAELVEKSSDV